MSQPLPPEPGSISGLYNGVHIRASARPGQPVEWSASQDGKTWHTFSREADGTAQIFLSPDGRIVASLRETVGLSVRYFPIPREPLDLMAGKAEALGTSLPVISDRLHQG